MIRVLHVFGDLGAFGGAEKWFLDILKLRDSRVHFDFLTSVCAPSVACEVAAAGSTIHYVPFSHSPLPYSTLNPYLNSARNILRQHNYDALHVHQFDLAGELLRIAYLEHIPKRIFTIHATKYNNINPLRKLAFVTHGKPWILHYSTNILPCSQLAAQNFNCQNLTKTNIIYPAINPQNFTFNTTTKNNLKSKYLHEFNIPQNKTIIGHIGRFTKQKNHQFLIKLLDKLIQNNNNFHAVLIGTGELLPQITNTINTHNLQNHITLAGNRNDIPSLANSLFDVLVLPSLYEGLPIVAIECLATGLAIVLSDKITTELNEFFPNRIFHEKLELENWINTIKLAINKKINSQLATKQLLNSPFNIKNSLEKLINVYEK
jgi:glycosyltransferase involved in cell wall biosynthesis